MSTYRRLLSVGNGFELTYVLFVFYWSQSMSDDKEFMPASRDDLMFTLMYGLSHRGKKRVHFGDDLMARLTAENLIENLEQAGFVVMRKPPAPGHSNPMHNWPSKTP